MQKIILQILVIFLFNPTSYAEKISLSTYYTSPYGNYQYLKLTPQPDLSNPCDPASLYVNNTGNLFFCKDTGTWDTFSDIWTVNGNNAYLTDTPTNPNLYIGLGTMTPTSRLMIQGKTTNSASSALHVINSSGTSLFIVKDSGQVGIGETSPTASLQIKGAASNGSTTGTLRITSVGESMIFDGSHIDTQNELYLNSKTKKNITLVESAGNVGIGTNAPAQKLDIDGLIRIVDGTQGDKRILTADNASGDASWKTAPIGGPAYICIQCRCTEKTTNVQTTDTQECIAINDTWSGWSGVLDKWSANDIMGCECRIQVSAALPPPPPPPAPPPPAPFNFSLTNGGNKTVTQGQSVNNSITATLTSPPSQSITFNPPSGLPAGATYSYAPAACTPTCSTTLTINTTGSSPTGNYTITVTAAGGGVTKTTSFKLTVNAASPPSLQTTVTGTASNSNQVSTSSAVTGLPNQLYLAAVTSRSHPTVTSVTGLGLTWTQVRDQCSARDQTGMVVWKAIGTPTGNGVVTARLTSVESNLAIAVSRYSGVNPVNPIGVVVGGNWKGKNDTTCSESNLALDTDFYSIPLTTTAPNSVIYSSVAIRCRSHTPGSGYTEIYQFYAGASCGNSAGMAGEEKTVVNPSATVVNGTIGATIDWAMVGVEIKGN